jgi:hypothetical protein
MMRVREMPIPRPSLANPSVTPELDAIVMTALERDPGRRWPSAAAMRDRIRAVIAQAGTAATNQDVIDWVTWVLAQKRGRAPQLTPMMPMPIRSAPIATSGLPEAAAMPAPPSVAFRWTLPNVVWTACACALILLLLGSIVWKIAG